MTQIVHIANTNLEFEFGSLSLEPLEKSLSRHALFLQLQFLPLLYAAAEDTVAVTTLPDESYFAALQEHIEWWPKKLPKLALLHSILPFQGMECLAWGASRQVQAWSEARGVTYHTPEWQVAQFINSKAFSLRYSALSEAVLLSNQQALIDWLQRVPGPKVLKTCFGLAGQGNWRVEGASPSPDLLNFCRKEWGQKRPIIAEPWLDRVSDFSTQWYIHPDQRIELIGATRFDADSEGSYQGTLAGPCEILFDTLEPFLQEHCHYVQKVLYDIAALGFFGNLGIDAFLYRDSYTQTICLNPLVEINARQTMSLVALRLQQRICPKQILRLAFEHTENPYASLLPDKLINYKGKAVEFRRKLAVEILS